MEYLVLLLLALGTATLASLIVKVAIISMRWLKNKLRERMMRKNGGQVIIDPATVQEALDEYYCKHKETANRISFDDMFGEDDGIIVCSVGEEDNINTEDIEIFSTEHMDADVKRNLDNSNGMIIVTA